MFEALLKNKVVDIKHVTDDHNKKDFRCKECRKYVIPMLRRTFNTFFKFTPRFRHPEGADCDGSILHDTAQDVISKAPEILLPNNKKEFIKNATTEHFISTYRRADIWINNSIAIEVEVTHANEPEKIELYKKADFLSFNIKLDKNNFDINTIDFRAKVKQEVLYNSEIREWIDSKESSIEMNLSSQDDNETENSIKQVIVRPWYERNWGWIAGGIIALGALLIKRNKD